jgi:hypothetical protein
MGTLTNEDLKELLATRDQRQLQSLDLGSIHFAVEEPLAELVVTDPKRDWKLNVEFVEGAGTLFCAAAMIAYAKSGNARHASLRDLKVICSPKTLGTFALHLLTLPSITSFVLKHREEDEPTPSWCRVPSKLLHRDQLHTFVHTSLPAEYIRADLQRNHSIIACEPRFGNSGFRGPLLFNRVRPSALNTTSAVHHLMLSANSMEADLALELEPCGAGSELRRIDCSNGVCTALLHSAAHRLNHPPRI